MSYATSQDYSSGDSNYNSPHNNETVKYEINQTSSTPMCSRGCNPCNGCRH
jgi:hypothetical protein